jgi:tetratricopeptide (TPR) repeat protein
MKKACLLLIGCFAATFIIAQTNYMEKGNQYIGQGNFVEAEKIFRQAVKAEPSNLDYQSQLAFTLSQQKKHAEAESILVKVLATDSTHLGALWYAGINNFEDDKADLRKAISYFERALKYLDKESGQYFSAHWLIGRAYRILLRDDGLSYGEASRMIEALSTYVKLQPDADDAGEITSFIAKVKEKRPPENVKKWRYIN